MDPRMATRESRVGSSASASHLRYLTGNPNRAGATGHLYEHINAEQLLSHNRFRLRNNNAIGDRWRLAPTLVGIDSCPMGSPSQPERRKRAHFARARPRYFGRDAVDVTGDAAPVRATAAACCVTITMPFPRTPSSRRSGNRCRGTSCVCRDAMGFCWLVPSALRACLRGPPRSVLVHHGEPDLVRPEPCQ